MCSSCKSDTSHRPVSGCDCHAGAASKPDECECKYGGSFCPSCEHYNYDPIVEPMEEGAEP
jgi:hypothetical protein